MSKSILVPSATLCLFAGGHRVVRWADPTESAEPTHIDLGLDYSQGFQSSSGVASETSVCFRESFGKRWVAVVDNGQARRQ